MKPAEAVYDRTAIEYDLRSGNPYTESVRAAEASLIGRHARGRILDAGCGTGYHMRALDNITGVDISREMVKLARNTGKPVSKGDVEKLAFGREEFDTVLCMYSVLNVCDLKKSVKELCRVTRPEGRVIISVSSLYDKGYRNMKEKRSVTPDRYTQTKNLHISGHKLPFHLFTREELEKEFSRHGFCLDEFGSVFRGVQPHWGLWKRLSLSERLGLLLDRFRPVEYGAFYLMVFKPADNR